MFQITENLSNYFPLETVAFSPENPSGLPSGGSKGNADEKLHPSIEIPPGATETLVDTTGPATICSMWFTGDISQSLILRIYWDGQDYPSVESPIGSFFGYGYPHVLTDQNNQVPILNSAMILFAPCRGMSCYWPMPFRTHCTITIENRNPASTHTLYYMITMQKGDIPRNSLYFHANYRQAFPVPTHQAYTVLDNISGAGHFVGMSLSVGTNNPNGCWVEGEAKIYLNGELYPTINYTGTEDYFLGAYAFGYDRGSSLNYHPYSGLYAGMYAVLGSNHQRYCYQPRFMMYRFHIVDPIHFQTSFRMTLQNIGTTPYGTRSRRDDYSSCAYWYQTLPSAPFEALPSDESVLQM